jgi:microcystin-dependent protein
MANPFVGEVRVFPFNFPPKGWAFCNGQLLPLSQNTALFSLLGTYYGGNGVSTFGLPNLQGNLANCQGQLAGGSLYDLGQVGGTPNVTLLTSEMTSHNHSLNALEIPQASSPSHSGATLGSKPGVTNIYSAATSPIAQFSPAAVVIVGGNQPHNNLMPYLTLNFCIALQGVFPSRP